MKIRILFLSAALAAAAIASASLTQVYSYGALGANDTIDHGQLGPTGTIVADPTTEVSTFGIHAALSMPDGASFERVDQGNGWDGDFPNGDHLLWTNYDAGPLNVNLDQSVISIGMALEANYYGNFTASMTVYDGLGRNLGTFTNDGFEGLGQGSLAFLGVVSTRANIASISVSVASVTGNNDFAIDHIDLNNCSPTPEPAAFAALGLGLVGLLLRRKSA